MEGLKKRIAEDGYSLVDKKYFDRGGHGQLFKCKNTKTGELCALKVEKKKRKIWINIIEWNEDLW